VPSRALQKAMNRPAPRQPKCMQADMAMPRFDRMARSVLR